MSTPPPLPDPATLLPPDVVAKNNIIIAYSTEALFTPDPQSNCGFVTTTVVYCTTDTCVFWQFNPDEIPNHLNVLKFLLLVDEYAKIGIQVMNYDISQAPVHRTYTGSDGITRRIVLEVNNELCAGYGGASFNGSLWSAIGKGNYWVTDNTIEDVVPVVHQVIFYETGRSIYDLKLDEILDWQMQNPNEWGYWTLGFNGAMTVLAPERMGVEMDYAGQDIATFRQNRLDDLATYINNPAYTFDNTWSYFLLPWNSNQSINDVMSGLLIYLADTYGGLDYLQRLFFRLKQQPITPRKTDRRLRATNFFRAAYRAALDLHSKEVANEIRNYFYNTLRWTFI